MSDCVVCQERRGHTSRGNRCITCTLPKQASKEIVGRCMRKLREETSRSCVCQGSGYQSVTLQDRLKDGRQYSNATLIPCQKCRPRAKF